ncbi:MAG TPA: cobalt transporter CbiM [Fimbriimonadaceae bacterium]|nr:cobalt transporter CbiM [Fimbriimonadaceae bacterium]
MHIPDAYLSPQTQLATGGAMAAMLAVAARKTRKTLTTKQVPLVSVGAAFCFAIQMFNIPAVGGTSAHALGTVLLAILLGPWTAMLTLTVSLAVQAVLFGDGGVLSLGANAFDMAFIPAFAGYAIYRLILRRAEPGSGVSLFAAAVAAYAGTALASVSAGVLLGIQPLLAHDGAGHALYFPFGLNVSVPAMVTIHLLVAAPAEAIITVFALAYLWRNFPEFVQTSKAVRAGVGLRLSTALAAVLLLTPLGLLAGADAWGEWDSDALAKMAGYVPAGIAHAKPVLPSALPDYSLPGHGGNLWMIAGYVLSACIGAGLVAVVTRGVVSRGVAAVAISETRRPPTGGLPAWMMRPNAASRHAPRREKPWLEPILLRMRSTLEETVVFERVARSPGLSQSFHPAAKTLVVACGLIGIALVGRPAVLGAIFVAILLIAVLSKVPLASFVRRLAIIVAFFGILAALPVAFAAVTPGPVLAGPFSRPGVELAVRILLRLACGIGLAILWTQTTRWNELVAALRRLGLPHVLADGILLAYRYIFVVVQTLEEMVTARRSRQVGGVGRREARAYSGTGAAILFAKSYAFTDELHAAMRSRCFDHRAPTAEARRFTSADTLAVIGGVAAVLLIVWLRVVHAL